VAEEIAEAAEELSRNKTGAIIAVERGVGLGEYVETGTPLHARVSSALLQNIFTPYSLLHDGAAIISGDEIVAAGSILPLTQSPVTDRTLGTRHRAALGLSEETDALVVVVSEETGVISLAHRGRLERGFTPDRLRDLLRGEVPAAGVAGPHPAAYSCHPLPQTAVGEGTGARPVRPLRRPPPTPKPATPAPRTGTS
jgi:diadenylate cyclase